MVRIFGLLSNIGYKLSLGKGSIRSSLGFGDRVLTFFSICFHLGLLEDEHRLSIGEFDKCNYLHLFVLILCSLCDILVGFR